MLHYDDRSSPNTLAIFSSLPHRNSTSWSTRSGTLRLPSRSLIISYAKYGSILLLYFVFVFAEAKPLRQFQMGQMTVSPPGLAGLLSIEKLLAVLWAHQTSMWIIRKEFERVSLNSDDSIVFAHNKKVKLLVNVYSVRGASTDPHLIPFVSIAWLPSATI